MSPEDKGAALFPKRIANRRIMFHRPVARSPNIAGNIWPSFSPDLKHWSNHQEIIYAYEGIWWDANKIGLSALPIEASEGLGGTLLWGPNYPIWLNSQIRGAALLDLEDLTRIIHRTSELILGPEATYEREGDVDDVVFPCGWIAKDGNINIYYGAANSCHALLLRQRTK